MMNPRENYLALLNHEETDYIPFLLLDGVFAGGQLETFENGPVEGGLDGWGCNWIPTSSAGGQPALDPTVILLEDVCDWEDVVQFPDLDAFDWQGLADMQLAGQNRDEKIIEYHSWNSTFLRMSHLMGFEGALCAMIEEPEASYALLDAIADHKVRVIERAYEYFKPDTFVHYDDTATERATFMSPETYRELIKPSHKKINDAALAYGMIPETHICGYCTEIIEDTIEEGSAAWQAAQPMNDIAALIEKYGDRFAIIGGFDSNGGPGLPDSTPEEITADIDRCWEEYGKFGKAYGFFGFFLGAMDDPVTMGKYGIMIQHILGKRGITP